MDSNTEAAPSESLYPDYIVSLEDVGALIDQEVKTVTMCLKGQGRSPEDAELLVKMGHEARALKGGLSGLAGLSDKQALGKLTEVDNLIANVSQRELERNSGLVNVLNWLNRHRKRRVVMAPNGIDPDILKQLT